MVLGHAEEKEINSSCNFSFQMSYALLFNKFMNKFIIQHNEQLIQMCGRSIFFSLVVGIFFGIDYTCINE